jgi:hypothetical protein
VTFTKTEVEAIRGRYIAPITPYLLRIWESLPENLHREILFVVGEWSAVRSIFSGIPDTPGVLVLSRAFVLSSVEPYASANMKQALAEVPESPEVFTVFCVTEEGAVLSYYAGSDMPVTGPGGDA